MEPWVRALLAAASVPALTAEVAAWVTRGEVERVGLWCADGARKRRLCTVGLPADWSLPPPPADPWLRLGRDGMVALPDRPADRLHALRDGDGAFVGAVLLPDDGPTDRAEALGLALARALAADEVLLRSRLLEALVELVRDGVLVVNADGDLLAYSPSLEAVTGWTVADVRRHGWTNLVYSDPAVRAEVQRGIAALLRGWPSEGQVRTLSRKDGAEVRVAIWSRAVPDPAGGSPALLGVMRDVTTDEDARRRTAREEGLAQLGRIAGRIAHEYNNLLCAVMGHAELIEQTPELPEIVAKRAGTIVRSARRGAHLSSRLLAFTGASRPRPVAVDVAEVVQQVRDLYGPRLPHGVSITVQAARGCAEVDPTQLQQAVMNLLVNGAESMVHGGELVVGVREAPLPTEVRYLAPDAPPAGTPMIEIRVTDQGPGFTAHALQHLFEPFFTEKRDGHGMGLPAVRGMLAVHGGAADVQNGAPPTGAVVTLWLPRSLRPELRLTAGPPARIAARVWLLDDQEPVLEFSRVALVAAGASVEAFAGAVPLLAAAAATPAGERPDVLVLDVQLADGDGPSTLRALRALGFDAPVVWTTGHTPETVTIPPGTVLRKPYTGADLVAAVLPSSGAHPGG